MEVSIETRTRDQAFIIEISGEVDLYSSPLVREKVLQTIQRQRPPLLLIELSQVTYMDSSGIATLVEGLQLSKDTQTRFLLVGLSQAVLEVFQLVRLERVFEIYATEDDALNEAQGEKP
ncbi:anti-sigma factor antagonist [candidate division KSB3 bacterium]|uniref:Anti-sigma factor antagonist n=1 Tax=candidate division KSB3 bacterium TaxID=2044937 RepID=A0A9D5JZ54_9BACT|nr:anti-sigma factor antagonist [candidate division KSB3 bacterium]MBD3326903.1 anti-sigma factor antagonist [candidate division KSB3 bacterium]